MAGHRQKQLPSLAYPHVLSRCLWRALYFFIYFYIYFYVLLTKLMIKYKRSYVVKSALYFFIYLCVKKRKENFFKARFQSQIPIPRDRYFSWKWCLYDTIRREEGSTVKEIVDSLSKIGPSGHVYTYCLGMRFP